MEIYDVRRKLTMLLVTVAAAAVIFFMYYSPRLVEDLAVQERDRMELWADATRRLASDSTGGSDVDFMLSVIEANRSIPVLLTDDEDNILLHRNFELPEPSDTLNAEELSETNRLFLLKRLKGMRQSGNAIDIELAPGYIQHLYYDDSSLLKRITIYPYVLMLVMAAFVAMVYFAVISTKKAEQNKVWVGLSKETAHQLGTPISSLMAWTEYLRATDTEPDAVNEIEKDVQRLASIASRFSKIGSRPEMERGSVTDMVARVCDYMRLRVSKKIKWSVNTDNDDCILPMCEPLLQWVMENLIKNAVDAMGGEGQLTIVTERTASNVIIDVTDTGCGIPRKAQRAVFRPGFTTRRRGWGLGLTLARRIVEDYHHGRIYVKQSEPGIGTTFRIELPES